MNLHTGHTCSRISLPLAGLFDSGLINGRQLCDFPVQPTLHKPTKHSHPHFGINKLTMSNSCHSGRNAHSSATAREMARRISSHRSVIYRRSYIASTADCPGTISSSHAKLQATVMSGVYSVEQLRPNEVS